MYPNKNLHSSSVTLTNKQKSSTYSYNSEDRLQKPQYMKILIQKGCVTENAIFMQFYVIIPDTPSFIQLAVTVTRNNFDLPVVSNSHKLLAEFHSGTLRIMDTMRLISLFSIIARAPIEVPLNKHHNTEIGKKSFTARKTLIG